MPAKNELAKIRRYSELNVCIKVALYQWRAAAVGNRYMAESEQIFMPMIMEQLKRLDRFENVSATQPPRYPVRN